MSRALTALGALLLFSTAGCLYPHSRHGTHHGTHGSVYVGWRHHSPPPPVVHSHGPNCGHVQVGAEWKVCPPGTRYGAATPPPTSGRHDRGLHRGHDVAPPKVEYSSPVRVERSQDATVHEVVSVLHESAEDHPAVQDHDGHPGRGQGPDKAQGTGPDKAQGKGHDKAQGKGHDKHDD